MGVFFYWHLLPFDKNPEPTYKILAKSTDSLFALIEIMSSTSESKSQVLSPYDSQFSPEQRTIKTMVVNRKSSSNLAALLELMPTDKGKEITTRVVRSLQKGPYLWDPWILNDGDVYRLFYLMAPKPVPPLNFWSKGTIYGAVSKDLQNWKFTGIVLEPEPSNTWEAGRILAGSTYKEDGIYYLFYSASGAGDTLKNERIGIATSTDALNWKRYSSNPLFSEKVRSRWYGTQKDTGHFHWRDPYVVKDYRTSKYYMFISAYLKDESLNPYQGCIGLAIADTITGPYELLPPVASPSVSEIEDWPFLEMERPQIIYRNGKYYLFFSCWPSYLNPKWIEKLGAKQVRENQMLDVVLFWFVSDHIGGPYKPAVDIPIVKGSGKTGMYGTNFFPIPGNLEEFMAIGWYHRLSSIQVSQRFKAYFKEESIEIRRNWGGICK
jgi:beta-fructofuranosidase